MDEISGSERNWMSRREGITKRDETSNYHRTLSTSNGLLNKHATLVETPPSKNSCSHVFSCSGRPRFLFLIVAAGGDASGAVMASPSLSRPLGL